MTGAAGRWGFPFLWTGSPAGVFVLGLLLRILVGGARCPCGTAVGRRPGPIPGRCDDKAVRNRSLTRGQKLSNTILAAVRAPVEHGFAHLKNWCVLGKVRTDSAWSTALVRALLVLTNREVAR